MKAHNTSMKKYLADNGIIAIPKYIEKGSLSGSWRIYGKGQFWSEQLAKKLTDIGFKDFDWKPLDKFSAGVFHIFAKTHKFTI